MTTKRAFCSFDFDQEEKLELALSGQLKVPTSTYSSADRLTKNLTPQGNWETEEASGINRSDVVVVLVEPKTHNTPGVLKELAIARLPKSLSFTSSSTSMPAQRLSQLAGNCLDGSGRTSPTFCLERSTLFPNGVYCNSVSPF